MTVPAFLGGGDRCETKSIGHSAVQQESDEKGMKAMVQTPDQIDLRDKF